MSGQSDWLVRDINRVTRGDWLRGSRGKYSEVPCASTLIAGVAFSWGGAVEGVLELGFQPGAGGCAQAWRSSGLAFQGRNRSRSGPRGDLPPLRPHSSR